MTKNATKKQTVDKPHDWDKALSCANLMLLGSSAKAAAKVAGVSYRTIRVWIDSEWWGKCRKEARERFMSGLETKALVSLGVLVDSSRGDMLDAPTVRFVAERIAPEFAPPKQRLEQTGADGGPIMTEVLAHQKAAKDMTDDELAAAVTRGKK